MRYFDEKNIKKPFWITDTKKDDKRLKRHLRTKKEVGVDPREAWNMDYSFVTWLFNTLNLLVDEGGKMVDFTFYKITICGKTKNELEWINIMIKLCEDYLRNADTDIDDRNHYRVKAITKIFHHTINYLWW